MPSREKTEERATEAEGQRQPKRQTVQVAKEWVIAAKKVAVLQGLTLARYAGEVLAQCADLVEKEIAELGPLGVRDRAEAIDFSQVPKGTFNIEPAIATRINQLAGSCLISAAKLVHPYLRDILQKHLRSGGQEGSEIPFGAWLINALFPSGNYRPVVIKGRSLEKYGYEEDDVAVVTTDEELAPGDTIITLERGKLGLRTIRHPDVPNARDVPGTPRLIDTQTARHAMIGKVVSLMKKPPSKAPE